MSFSWLLLLGRALLVMFVAATFRGQAAPATSSEELQTLVAKISEKLRAGQRTPEALKAELVEFDALFQKHAAAKGEDAARVLFVKSSLYAQVFRDFETASGLLRRIETEFPGTETAHHAAEAGQSINRMLEADRARAAIVGKPAPELNFTWSSQEGLKSLSGLKGKVVVLDFWATWCGPCVASFPQMRELTAHYAKSDVAILGVTSLQGRVVGMDSSPIDTNGNPKKEYSLMADYIRAKSIDWTIAFSEEPVFNPAYGITGIPHMAIVAPDGTIRHTGLHPAMPHEEKVRLIDALLKEFGKPPAGSGTKP